MKFNQKTSQFDKIFNDPKDENNYFKSNEPLSFENIEKRFLNKINNETRFIFLYVFYTFLIYSTVFLKNNNVNNYKEKNAIFLKDFASEDKINVIIEKYSILLKDYYKNNNTDEGAKEIFSNIFFEFVSNFAKYCEINKIITDDLKTLMQNKEKYNIFLKQYNKKCKNEIVKEIDDTEMPECFSTNQISEEQFAFIKNKTKKLVLESFKIKKNDIYDLFFIYSYSDYFVNLIKLQLNKNFTKDKIVLLSFDKNLMSEIEKFSPISKSIMDFYMKK